MSLFETNHEFFKAPVLIQQGLVTRDIGYLLEMGLLCFVCGAHFLHNSTHCAVSKQIWKSPRVLDSLEALLVGVVFPGIVNHTGKGLL